MMFVAVLLLLPLAVCSVPIQTHELKAIRDFFGQYEVMDSDHCG